MRALAILLLVLSGLLPGEVLAQGNETVSLRQLLEWVREAKLDDAAAETEREARFVAARNEQAAALEELRKPRDALLQRSIKLEHALADGAEELRQRQQQLDASLEVLGDVFSRLESDTDAMRLAFDTSLSSTQFGHERIRLVDELLAVARRRESLPEIAQLDALWYEMQRELVAGGEIVRYDTPLAGLSGISGRREVIRVGLFNVVTTSGEYLHRSPDHGLAQLVRQPESRMLQAAASLNNARSMYADFGIDPLGAQGSAFLETLVGRPRLSERLLGSGNFGLFIMLIGALAPASVLLFILTHRHTHPLPVDLARDRESGGKLVVVLDSTALLTVLGSLFAASYALMRRFSDMHSFDEGLSPEMAGILAQELVILVQGFAAGFVIVLSRALLVWQLSREPAGTAESMP